MFFKLLKLAKIERISPITFGFWVFMQQNKILQTNVVCMKQATTLCPRLAFATSELSPKLSSKLSPKLFSKLSMKLTSKLFHLSPDSHSSSLQQLHNKVNKVVEILNFNTNIPQNCHCNCSQSCSQNCSQNCSIFSPSISH